MGFESSRQPKNDLTATIANGAAISSVVDLGSRTPVGFFIPTGMEGTTLTFQASPDNVTFYQVLDESGAVLTLTIAAGKFNKIDPSYLCGVNYLKLVAAGNVGAQRVIILATRPLA